jgi:hypothetical protein
LFKETSCSKKHIGRCLHKSMKMLGGKGKVAKGWGMKGKNWEYVALGAETAGVVAHMIA